MMATHKRKSMEVEDILETKSIEGYSGSKKKKGKTPTKMVILKEDAAVSTVVHTSNPLANITHKRTAVSNNWMTFKETLKHLENTNKRACKSSESNSHSQRLVHDNTQKKPVASNSIITAEISKLKANVTKIDNVHTKQLTRHIAMDCEMVGIEDGNDSMLARVSLVNKHGHCIYDKFVKPTEPVVDYRTSVSGVRPEDLTNGETFQVVQNEVADILKGRILVGHALSNDLKVLYLSHPRKYIRDTSKYKPFRKVVNGRTPSLKKLAAELLGVTIQQGEHNSIIDARTTMQLYVLYKKEWEADIHKKKKHVTSPRTPTEH